MKKIIIGTKYRIKPLKEINKYIEKKNIHEWNSDGYRGMASKFVTIIGFMNSGYETKDHGEVPRELVNLETKIKVPRNITILINKFKRDFKFMHSSSVAPGAGNGYNYPMDEIEIHPMINPNSNKQIDIMLFGSAWKNSFTLTMDEYRFKNFMNKQEYKYKYRMTSNTTIRYEYTLIKESEEVGSEFDWVRN
jgi:hypothetical protein|tara:strand:- start:36470 stop:37045 length:576 start_codon:yes stop_codon:yes gene_type:complete